MSSRSPVRWNRALAKTTIKRIRLQTPPGGHGINPKSAAPVGGLGKKPDNGAKYGGDGAYGTAVAPHRFVFFIAMPIGYQHSNTRSKKREDQGEITPEGIEVWAGKAPLWNQPLTSRWRRCRGKREEESLLRNADRRRKGNNGACTRRSSLDARFSILRLFFQLVFVSEDAAISAEAKKRLIEMSKMSTTICGNNGSSIPDGSSFFLALKLDALIRNTE